MERVAAQRFPFPFLIAISLERVTAQRLPSVSNRNKFGTGPARGFPSLFFSQARKNGDPPTPVTRSDYDLQG